MCVGSCCGSGLGGDEALGQGSQHTHVHTGEVGSPGPCQLLPTQHPSCKDSACKLQGLRPLETRRRRGQRAGAWFILSPLGWRTISFCQVKSCLFLGFSLRPRMNAKPTAQIGKLRPMPAGRSQEPLCLPPFRGQSVCLSTHPSSGHYPPPNPLSAPLSLSPATPSQRM